MNRWIKVSIGVECIKVMYVKSSFNEVNFKSSNLFVFWIKVGSFVWTHLTNIQETQSISPNKRALKRLVGTEFLKNKWNTDVRKFSRYFEASHYNKVNIVLNIWNLIRWAWINRKYFFSNFKLVMSSCRNSTLARLLTEILSSLKKATFQDQQW